MMKIQIIRPKYLKRRKLIKMIMSPAANRNHNCPRIPNSLRLLGPIIIIIHQLKLVLLKGKSKIMLRNLK
jgi:hypothetical protein